jgi:hypothetical protein
MTRDDRIASTGYALLAAAFGALTLAISLFKYLDGDEIEHVHSTWHVLNGRLPYVDFFEHHHSLLWYCLAPVLAVTGQSASAVIAFRLIYFLLTAAILWATYHLALACRPSRSAAALSVVLLASMTTFVYVATEIRPDVPQILFGVLSATCLARLFQTRAARDAVLAGMFAAVAFLFLQKAVFLLLFYPLLFGVQALRGRLPWRLGLLLLGSFALACLPYFLFLAASRSLDDYVATNWLLNADLGSGRAKVSYLSPFVIRDFTRNAIFWVLALGVVVTAARRRLRVDYAVPAALGIGMVAVVFALNRVVDRYMAAAVPFLAVASAAWLVDLFNARQLRGVQRLAILALVCLVPAVAMVRAARRSNAPQLAQIQYVLDHSQAGDCMLDEWRDFNVFRPDMHYFWFLTRPGMPAYSRFTGGRFADFDLCREIGRVKPKFVSDRLGDLRRCGLLAGYRPTPFPHVLERARP